eukprot:scaffold10108_cov117-Isochrysis_galbana.AAC.2
MVPITPSMRTNTGRGVLPMRRCSGKQSCSTSRSFAIAAATSESIASCPMLFIQTYGVLPSAAPGRRCFRSALATPTPTPAFDPLLHSP